MRAGFIGTGGFARKHAAVLRHLGVAITACFSTNTEKAERFAADFGATRHDDPGELITREHLDVLYIAVPPFAHDGSWELAAVHGGIPFLVEKPVGLDLRACRSVAHAVAESKLVTCVGYLLRESAVLADVRRLFARNQLTSVRSCRMNGFPKVSWWRRMATSGGMMVEQATHMVDLMRLLLGEVRSVSAVTASGIARGRHPDCDVYDSMEALLRFDSGVIGSIGVANVFENDFTKIDVLEAFGRDFYLSLTFERLRYREGGGEWIEVPCPSLQHLLESENRRFLDAAARRAPADVTCTYADGLGTLEVTLAMNEAARTGQVVTLGPPP